MSKVCIGKIFLVHCSIRNCQYEPHTEPMLVLVRTALGEEFWYLSREFNVTTTTMETFKYLLNIRWRIFKCSKKFTNVLSLN